MAADRRPGGRHDDRDAGRELMHRAEAQRAPESRFADGDDEVELVAGDRGSPPPADATPASATAALPRPLVPNPPPGRVPMSPPASWLRPRGPRR